MVTALVFIHVKPQQVNDVATQIVRVRHVRTVYSLTGEIDLVAIVEVPDLDTVPEVVTDQIAAIEGVQSTQTHIAFRTYDPDELDAAFSIGN